MITERNGKKYAQKLHVFLSDKEWGSYFMSKVAQEYFRQDISLDAVEIYEHGGWRLTYLRDGTIVGTANTQAILQPNAINFLNEIYGYDSVGEVRRP